MYTGMLIPLDGSKTAEKVLPYTRYLAGRLKIPVELLAVIDIAELAAQVSAEKARFIDTMIEDGVRQSKEYLARIAETFPGSRVKCTIDKGRAEDVIIGRGEADRGNADRDGHPRPLGNEPLVIGKHRRKGFAWHSQPASSRKSDR